MRVTASAALLALRMWWLLIAILVAAGAALGVVAVRDAPYVAVTTLRVDTAGFGEVAQQSIVETARLLVDSNRTYRQVAGDAPEAIEELRQRTAVDIIASSSVLEVSVSAQDPVQAERELNALLDASITTMRELADEQYTGTVRSGEEALTNGVLPDPLAEEARREGIGTAISERQDDALRLSGQLSRIGAILPAVQTGLGSRIAAVIGGLAGGFAGAVLALVLGVGRRRIKRLSDVRAVAPGLLRAEPMDYTKGIVTIGSDCSRIDYALAMVLALPGAEDDLAEVVEAVRSDLRRNGSRPFRLDADEVLRAEQYADRRGAPARNGATASSPGAAGNGRRPLSAASGLPALGMPQRALDLSESHADTLLVTGHATDKLLSLAGERADVVLLVARPYRTTLGQLARVTAGLRSGRPPIVVLAKPVATLRGSSASRGTSAEGTLASPVPQPSTELVHSGVAAPGSTGQATGPPHGTPERNGNPLEHPTLRMSSPATASPRTGAPPRPAPSPRPAPPPLDPDRVDEHRSTPPGGETTLQLGSVPETPTAADGTDDDGSTPGAEADTSATVDTDAALLAGQDNGAAPEVEPPVEATRQ